MWGSRCSAGDARAPIKDYTLVDADLAKSSGAWTFSLAARNVFNAHAREPSLAQSLALPYDPPLPGRHLALTVERSF